MKNSQLSIAINEDGKQYLEYKEDVSKTNSGGLAHAHLKRTTVRAYENNEPERCPVQLYKEYMAHVPENAPANSFYLRGSQWGCSKHGTRLIFRMFHVSRHKLNPIETH